MRGPHSEATPGLVDDRITVAEGDCSKLATGGTSVAVPGTGETYTSKHSSERAGVGRVNSASKGDSSNLACNSVRDVPITVREQSLNISGKKSMSKATVIEEMEKAGEHENSEVLEEDQKEEQEWEDAEEEEEKSDSSIETRIEGVKIDVGNGHLRGKRKMKKMQATVAGHRGLPETEEKKQKREEANSRDTKHLKTCTDALQELRSGDITNTSDAARKEFNEKGTGLSGQKLAGEEEIVSYMTYAVVLEGFPGIKMSEDQAKMVVAALLERIKPSIQFSAMQYENGAVTFTCVNDTTKAWLFKTVHNIVPWFGARLEVGDAELLLKGTECILWVMAAMTKRSNGQILDLLQKQNKGISVAKWKVLRRVAETAERERLTLWVDSKSFEDLQGRNFKLFLGLDHANLMLASEFKMMTVSGGMANLHNPWPAVQNPQGPTISYEPCTPANIMSQNSPNSLIPNSRPQKSQVEEDAFNWLRVAVVLEGYPDVKMTEEQVELVGIALVAWINPSDEGEPIQFSEMEYESGALVLTCVNEETKIWIKETVRTVVPWPGARLVLGQAEVLLKGTKFILWVTGMKQVSNQQILDLLQKQNKGICTTEWLVFRRVTEGDKKTGLIFWVDYNSDVPTADWKVLKTVPEAGKRERLTLWVDNKSFEDLKARSFKLYLGFGQVKLMLISDWKKLMAASGCTRRTYKLHPLIPDSGPRAVHQSRERGLSGPNPHPHISSFEHRDQPQCRDVESASIGPSHIPDVHSMTSGRWAPRECTSTDPAVLQNVGSRLPASVQPCQHRVSVSERLQSQEVSYDGLDQMQHTERRYTLDLAQENKYVSLDHSKPCDIGYETRAPPRLSDPRFKTSHQVMRHRASNQAQSCHSRYVPLNQKHLENPSSVGWNRSPRDSLNPPESNLRLSSPQQFRQFGKTVSHVSYSQEDRFPGSGFTSHQSRSCYATQTYSRFSRSSESSRNNS